MLTKGALTWYFHLTKQFFYFLMMVVDAFINCHIGARTVQLQKIGHLQDKAWKHEAAQSVCGSIPKGKDDVVNS